MSIFSHTLDISQTDLEQRGQANLFNEEHNMEMISKIVQQKGYSKKKKEKKCQHSLKMIPHFLQAVFVNSVTTWQNSHIISCLE